MRPDNWNRYENRVHFLISVLFSMYMIFYVHTETSRI